MRYALILIALVSWMLSPTTADAQQPVRKGFTVGFDVGGGSGELNIDVDGGGEFNESESGAAFALRIGYAPNQKLVLAYDSAAFAYEKDSRTTTFAVGGFGATWYPTGGGGFVKGVLGFSRIEVEVDVNDVSVSADSGGFGGMVGGGYEFRLTRSFALVPAAHLAYGDFEDGDDNWFAITVGFHWYPSTPREPMPSGG